MGPERGGAREADRTSAGSHAAGVNHMNAPPEQIGSGEAGRPRREARRSAQLHMLTSKAELEGWRRREGGGVVALQRPP